ncbi:hypothetical protein [Aquihabitans sp. McL0605]|uniref:hypothetical protein n=1 Tax=Aquihabitans sp. McL0605 TaxID=3415671 RepID=UPI003CE8BCBF
MTISDRHIECTKSADDLDPVKDWAISAAERNRRPSIPTAMQDDDEAATWSAPDRDQKSIPVGLLLLFLRGALLWLVVPVGWIWWLAAWRSFRRQGIQPGQLVGWMDLNLISAIERTVLRPVVPSPLPWTPFDALPRSAHRVGLNDPL